MTGFNAGCYNNNAAPFDGSSSVSSHTSVENIIHQRRSVWTHESSIDTRWRP